MIIDTSKSYSAYIKTTKGIIDVTLRPDRAPESVNNFYILANLGYWDNFPFSNILRSRYALTGSPRATPYSDIGYFIPKEYDANNQELRIEKGILGYYVHAKLDGSSSGSNIYIMMTNDPRGKYGTPFGKVSNPGMEIVRSLTTEDKVITITIEKK